MGVPVQMLWIDGSLSTLERLAVVSFLRNGHPVHVYTYGQIPNLPQGATLFNAREIMPDSERFQMGGRFGYGSWGPFSNRFRYKLVYERGGIWCDTDMVCLRPLDFHSGSDHFFCTERQPTRDANNEPLLRANCCAFGAPAGSPLLADCYRSAMTIDPNAHAWGQTGPRLFDAKIQEHNLQDKCVRPEIFCDIDFWEFHKLFVDCHLLTGFEYCIHFWNESWRRNFLDKNADYHPLTLYERLKNHYGIHPESTIQT